MLKNVCSRCGRVIDGEPVLNKEYPDATLLLGEEVAVMYDDLCGECTDRIRRLVSDFALNIEPEPDPVEEHVEVAEETPEPASTPEPEPSPEPVEVVAEGIETVSEEVVETPVEQPKRQPRKAPTAEELPNQVTKQFKINLDERRNRASK